MSAVVEFQTEAILAGQQPQLASLDSISALRAWRDTLLGIRRHLRCHAGCRLGSLGELERGAKPGDLSIAMFAAVQGGILLSQIYRETAPLEIALDTMIDHIASLVVHPRKASKKVTRR